MNRLRYVLILVTLVSVHESPLPTSPVQQVGAKSPYQCLEAFLSAPVENFNCIKEVADLCNEIIQYDLKLARLHSNIRYLDMLFSRHFQSIDDKKAEVIVYLFLQLRACHGDIFDKTRAAFRKQPHAFSNALKDVPEWKHVVEGLVDDWEAVSAGISELRDSGFEKEVYEYAFSLHSNNLRILNNFEAFLEDPVANFDKIKNIDDISPLIGEYEARYIEKGELTVSVIGDLFHKHFTEVDETKIKIIIHLLQHCGSGSHAEILAANTVTVFSSHTRMFIITLATTPKWKSIIDSIIETGGPSIFKCLENLGSSDFEKEVKAYVAGKHGKIMLEGGGEINGFINYGSRLEFNIVF